MKNSYAMSTQFHWSSKRTKAALALAEGQSQQAVAEAIGVCRKTICNWLCVTAFAAEVDRLSCMIDVSSRAERLRMAMRAVRQKVRPDGTLETDKDVLDWLKFAQGETTGVKRFSKDEVQAMNAEFESVWQEAVEAEVNRRLAERGLMLEVQQDNGSQREIPVGNG
jgi:hypothetical protein